MQSKTMFQAAARAIYPGQCVSCDARVEGRFGICGVCWRDTPFVDGAICGQCGVPLVGGEQGEIADCDDCLANPKPWDAGRAALVYAANGRRLVLALKHGDREEIAQPLAGWMARAGQDIIEPGMLVAPIPLHWRRLVQRRFNQAALLSRAVAQIAGLTHVPDLLRRPKRTRSLDRLSPEERASVVEGAFTPHPGRQAMLRGARVLLVDDVMTTGATLAEATATLRRAGASHVCVLTLARATKDA